MIESTPTENSGVQDQDRAPVNILQLTPRQDKTAILPGNHNTRITASHSVSQQTLLNGCEVSCWSHSVPCPNHCAKIATHRGHKVLVVTTLPAAHGYLRRAAARHTSNTTAEAMQYITAEPLPVPQDAAAAGHAARQPTGQQQQLGQASPPAAASHKQQTWRGTLHISPSFV
jgi:hypothetical protein